MKKLQYRSTSPDQRIRLLETADLVAARGGISHEIWHEIWHEIVSPRDPASDTASGAVVSPRDPASGLPTGRAR